MEMPAADADPSAQTSADTFSTMAVDTAVAGGAPVSSGTPAPVLAERVIATRDSAGIRIVEPPARSWRSGERWRVDGSIFIQIGVAEGNDAEEFSYIDAGAIAEDGTLAIVDGHLGEVRLFDPMGAHLLTFGGVGDGPGEFRPAASAPGMSVAFGNADTIMVSDGRRISWFTLDGSVIRDLDVAAAIRDPKLIGSFEWQLGAHSTILLSGSIPAGSRAGQNWVYLARGHEGKLTFTAVAEYRLDPGLPIEASGGAPRTRLQRSFQPTAPAAVLTTDPTRVFVADPLRWEVRVHDANGSVQGIIRLPIPRAPVTSEWIADARRQLARRREKHPLRHELLSAFDAVSHPDSVPAIRSVFWDGTGQLWVEHYIPSFAAGEVERTFEVLRQSGEWLGRVTLPSDIGTILRIHADQILTRYADDDGVHHARVYTIIKQ